MKNPIIFNPKSLKAIQRWLFCLFFVFSAMSIETQGKTKNEIPVYVDALKSEIGFDGLESIHYSELTNGDLRIEFRYGNSMLCISDVVITHDLSTGEDRLCFTLYAAAGDAKAMPIAELGDGFSGFVIKRPEYPGYKLYYKDTSGFHKIPCKSGVERTRRKNGQVKGE